MGQSAASTGRLSVALERLLDPLDVPEARDRPGAGEPRTVSGENSRGERLPAAETGRDADGRWSRDSSIERLTNRVERLRWRLATVVYRLRWSHDSSYRVARAVLTGIAILAVTFGVVVLLLLTTVR